MARIASQTRSPESRLLRRYAFVAAGWLLALAVLISVCTGTLYSACYLTGWLFVSVVGWRAMMWAKDPALPDDRLRTRAAHELALTIIMISLFAVHIDFRVPNGWLDLALTAVFGLLVCSAIQGGRALRADPIEGAARLRRWTTRHAGVLGVLIALAGFHGVFVHTHGVVASMLVQN